MSIWFLNAVIIEGTAILGVLSVVLTKRTRGAFALGFGTMLPVTAVYVLSLNPVRGRAFVILLMVVVYLGHMTWLVLAQHRSTAIPKLDARLPLLHKLLMPVVLANTVGWIYCLPFYFAARNDRPFGTLDVLALAVYALGTLIHFGSDYQKHRFKRQPESRGRLLTTGFWALCRHPNYFGDFLVYVSFAILAQHPLGWIAPVTNVLQYLFDAIPKNETWAAEKYGEAWEEYKSRTKRFVPFVY